MTESCEIIFVEKGIYNIGYEINKKEFLRRQFGPSTNIGGFQVTHFKRFSFNYRAQTKMKCLAIKKELFNKLMREYPFFCSQLKIKFWEHYSQNIYQPLIKLRNTDILDFNFRKDYKQVLFLHDKSNGYFADLVADNIFAAGQGDYDDF